MELRDFVKKLLIKIIEFILIICCIGLIDEPATDSLVSAFLEPRVVAFCYVTYGCLIIYTSIYIIMTIVGDNTPWRTAAFWAIIGFLFFIATSALLFRDWANIERHNYFNMKIRRLDLLLGAASVSFITCIVYLVDIILTIRFGKSGELD